MNLSESLNQAVASIKGSTATKPHQPWFGVPPRQLGQREMRRANGRTASSKDVRLACGNPDHRDLHASVRAVKRVSGGRRRGA